ncbi:MAG: transketolase family protein [Pirellulales bacterium]|nr:transketolase family protein [Pirellulales bacterium]
MIQPVRTVAMRDVFGATLLALAERVPGMVVLDCDVATSCKTRAFGEAYPDRFFNCGVAEANMVDVAAGLATCGLRPVVSTFALFLTLKGADQIRNTVCYNDLPVVFVGGYAGLSDSFDGPSHQAITDLAVMRAMPNMVVVVPGDALEVQQAVEAALSRPGPTYIRVCRNPTPVLFEDQPPLEIGRVRKLRDGADLTLGVCGVPTSMAIEASEKLAQEGIGVDLLEISTLKPLDVNAILASVSKTGKLLSIEEHNRYGGLAEAVALALAKERPTKMDYVAIEDTFAESGSYEALMAKYGLSVDRIVEKAKALVTSCGPNAGESL